MPVTPRQPIQARDLHTEGTRLLNTKGQEVRLHGINLIHKGSKLPEGGFQFIPHWPEDLYQRFAGHGFNLIRLGILWTAIEPAPGQYDESYLQFIEDQLNRAHKAGIAVFLDMHQDLYAQRASDGAPDWACLTDTPFEATALWSDAYLTSAFVQECWDAFWGNQPVPATGLGLQDHFANTWAMLAKRFAGHPALFGYDILNEPAPGSEIQLIFGQLLLHFYGLLTQEERQALGITEPDPEQMAGLFLDPEAKLQLLHILNDPERYRALGELSQERVIHFERGILEPFYEKITAVIRVHDTDSFIFRGNNYLSNIGIPSGIRPITVNGLQDPKQIFAPHGYDLVVDTEAMADPSDSRALSIFTRHRETQLMMNIPAVVTEWGAFAAFPSARAHGRFLLDLFQSWGWGQTYWCYTGDFFETPAAELLKDGEAREE